MNRENGRYVQFVMVRASPSAWVDFKYVQFYSTSIRERIYLHPVVEIDSAFSSYIANPAST